jgi:phosphate transport system permease protein
MLVRGRARGISPSPAPAGAAAGRESVTRWGDRVTHAVAAVAGMVPLGALAFIVIVMVVSAIPAILFSGTGFFTGSVFSLGSVYAPPVHHHGLTAPFGASYGALPLILGTFVTSLIAIGLAVPISVGGVLMLSEWLPRRAQSFLSLFLELLAGIPSVVFGIWGVYTFGPFMAAHVYPLLTGPGTVIPWLKGPVGAGQGLLTASLVLAIMVVPIVAATTRELVRRVPTLAREGALALGMTRHETAKVVTIPYVRTGILAAALLGWGRALGETMAVLFIIGNVLNGYPQNLYLSANTLSATIAGTLDGALTDSTGTDISALAEIGLVLLVISLVTNFAGRLVIRRVSDQALPVGRGV